LSPVKIRSADSERDAAACAAIYAPHVEASATSFEAEPPTAVELAERIKRTSATHPWLVAESDDGVVGFAYACEHRTRAAYRWAVDVSIYLAETSRGQGLGRALYEELFDRLRAQRFRVACAGVTLPNEASVRLHEGLGFSPVGVYRRIGWKVGAWHDVGWWQLDLSPDGEDPPEEPLAPEYH
jgi:phosphinothricin acetyltransferase